VPKKVPGDRAVSALAAQQHGVVARRQLVALGVSGRAIRHRLETGRLHPVHVGVYAVGHPRVVGAGHWMAAVLACGDGAVLSHRSAAALWGLRQVSTRSVDVTAVGRSRHSRQNIALHRVRTLHRVDCSMHNSIPVTTVARTLLDLAEVLRPSQLERAFEEAERLRLLDIAAVSRICDRSTGRRGVRALNALLSYYRGPVPQTRSELERQFVDVCRDAGLPPPKLNLIVEGFEVDAAWPDRCLIVELDGYAFHRTRAAFECDRLRDAGLQVAGHRVLRVTARRLVDSPHAVAETIRQLLGAT
jgi:very-short-patch-repair endonuclease